MARSSRVIRAVSAVGVIASIAYLLAAFIYLALDKPKIHARFMLYGALVLFPYSVSLAYVSSVAKKRVPSLIPLTVGNILLLPLPVLWLYGVSDSFLEGILIIAGLLGVPSAFLVARERKASVKLSLELVGLTYTIMAVSAASAVVSTGLLFHDHALALVYAFPLPLVYSVTVNAFPATFKDQPSKRASYLLPLLSLVSAILVLRGNVLWANIVFALTLLLYIYAARLYRIPRYKAFLDNLPEGPGRDGLAYFLWGHLAVLVLSAIIVAYMFLGGSMCSSLCILHLLALGFTSLHVWIHGPMMLPVILGMKHRRRFNTSPYALLLLATLAFPFSGIAAFSLYILSLAAALLIVV